MLNNSIGVFFYLLLQNRWSWALLKEEEREIIFEANECHNNDRQDYSWESYQGSKNWDSEDDRAGSYRIGWGPWIMKFLEEKKPRSILEIGPGSGYFSKIICEHKSVSSYYGLEINKNFSDYLNRKLKNLQKNNFKYKIIQGDWKSTDLPKVDAIVILSALHHIRIDRTCSKNFMAI